ncbi:unnamed protein product, partial [Prorocentrum cordatum]
DCLVLNVFVQRWRLPSEQCTGADVVGTCGRGEQANAEALAPVLVYIHGGSGMHGAAHNPGASGADLAESQDLVCIDVNYRLGILGFLAHPELSAEDAEAAQAGDPWGGSGSYALLDQVAALEWVQQHAASFGGDPDRVTTPPPQTAPPPRAYLGNFARHGDPNGAGLPAWPAKSPGSALYLEVGSGPKAKALSERDRRRHRLLGCHYFSGRVLAEVQRGEPAAGRPPLGYACGWPEA